jgi:hypothetical protein
MTQGQTQTYELALSKRAQRELSDLLHRLETSLLNDPTHALAFRKYLVLSAALDAIARETKSVASHQQLVVEIKRMLPSINPHPPSPAGWVPPLPWYGERA